jgi:uncharacterized membrane protein YraQ (UPF0718 family)
MGFSTESGWGYFLTFVVAMFFLYGIAFILSIRIKAFLSQTRVERLFLTRSGLAGNVLSAAFGAVTPFCSCTTIPIFATINPPALILLVLVFGWKVTAYYTVAVFVMAVLGGRLLGQRGLSGLVFELFLMEDDYGSLGWGELVRGYFRFLKGFAVIILFAGIVATVVNGWMPSENTLAALTSLGGLAIPILVGAGVIIYADLMLLIPIAHSLVLKGMPEGSVLAFTMAASGLGIPTLILLSKVVHKKLILYYTAVVSLLLIGVGYLLNWLA